MPLDMTLPSGEDKIREIASLRQFIAELELELDSLCKIAPNEDMPVGSQAQMPPDNLFECSSAGLGMVDDFISTTRHTSAREPVSRENLRCQRIRNEVSKLKIRLNALSAAISILPPELLSEIFVHCAITPYPYLRHWRYIDDVTRSIRITHVCAHWRAVALSTPALWSQITLTGLGDDPEWVTELLQRSHQVPLTILFPSDIHRGPPRREAFELVAEHASRIRALFTAVQSGILILSMKQHTTILETLVWENRNLPPSALLARNIMHLRRLDLQVTESMSPWTLLVTSLLRHIKVMLLPKSDSGRPNLVEFLNALKGMPLLESVHLEGAIPYASHRNGHGTLSHEPLMLSQLCAIHVTDGLREIIQFLRHLSLPPVLSCLDTLSVTMDIISDHVHVGVQQTGNSSTIDINLQPDASSAIDISFHCGREISALVEGLDELLSNLPLTSITTLNLSNEPAMFTSPHGWIRVFSSLAHITVLSVHGTSCANHLFEALRLQPGDDVGKRQGQFLFPHLYTLRMQNIKLEQRHNHYNRHYIESLDKLLASLDTRSRCSAALAKLELRYCKNVGDEIVTSLREVVGEVIWDPSDGTEEFDDLDDYEWTAEHDPSTWWDVDDSSQDLEDIDDHLDHYDAWDV